MTTPTPVDAPAPTAKERYEAAERVLAAAVDRMGLRDGIDYRHDTYTEMVRRHESGNRRAVREVLGLSRSQAAPGLSELNDEQRATAGERAIELLREGAIRTMYDFGFCSTGISNYLQALGLPRLERTPVWRTSFSFDSSYTEPYTNQTENGHSEELKARLARRMAAVRAVLEGADEQVDGHLSELRLSVSAYPDHTFS